MIIDPWGRVLAAINSDKVGIAVADIDLAAVNEARGKVPSLANARPFSLSGSSGGPL